MYGAAVRLTNAAKKKSSPKQLRHEAIRLTYLRNANLIKCEFYFFQFKCSLPINENSEILKQLPTWIRDVSIHCDGNKLRTVHL